MIKKLKYSLIAWWILYIILIDVIAFAITGLERTDVIVSIGIISIAVGGAIACITLDYIPPLLFEGNNNIDAKEQEEKFLSPPIE